MPRLPQEALLRRRHVHPRPPGPQGIRHQGAQCPLKYMECKGFRQMSWLLIMERKNAIDSFDHSKGRYDIWKILRRINLRLCNSSCSSISASISATNSGSIFVFVLLRPEIF